MQHISDAVPAPLAMLGHLPMICDFIEELYAAKGRTPLSEDELEKTGLVWGSVLAEIPECHIEDRQPGCLFGQCAEYQGFVDAAKVLAIWRGGRGGQLRSEASDRSRREQESRYTGRTSGIGPGRRKLLEFLASRAYPESRLAIMASN